MFACHPPWLTWVGIIIVSYPVDEMADDFAISEKSWDELAASFDEPQLFELLFVVGGYVCLAGVLNSLGLRGEIPEEPAETGEKGAAP